MRALHGQHGIRRNRGISLIYMLIAMVTLTAFSSLAVDYGRVQLAKTELQRTADAVGRAAAAGIPTDRATAVALAQEYAALNKVDGQPLALDAASDIEFGKWDTSNRTFAKQSDFGQVNAIHIIARRSAARGNAIPMMFASLLGFNSCDIHSDAIVMVIPGVHVDQDVPATANPFLSGMPFGSVASRVNPHNNPDYAGTSSIAKQSPLAVAMPVTGGQTLTFDSITGDARHDPNLANYNPDGQLDDIGHNNLTTDDKSSYGAKMYNENGLADVWAPINSLVGVFLDDSQPDKTKAPTENLDFRTADSRDFNSLQPKIKQIFFIGDGANSKGNRQQFIAPAGATRLYLATWDFYEWNNNAGSRNIHIEQPAQIVTVK